MEIVLVVVAFVFLLVGLLGAVIPVLPGPPIGYVGLLLLQWSGHGSFSVTFLIVAAAITAAVTVMDYFLPAWLTKKFGGSRAAVVGSVLGLIVGLFFAPLGMLLGPFLGALIGELLNNSRKESRGEITTDEESSAANDKAVKVAFGAFLAFIVGTGAKMILGALMIYYAVKAMFS